MSEAKKAVRGSASYRKIPRETRSKIKKIPRDQLLSLRAAFLAADTNGDGTLSRAEFKKIMESDGSPIPAEELESMINLLDADGTGSLDFAEFLALVTMDGAANEKEEAMFKLMDVNKDGQVTKAEVKTALATMGIVMSDYEMNEFWAATAGNKGSFNREQFKKVFNMLSDS